MIKNYAGINAGNKNGEYFYLKEYMPKNKKVAYIEDPSIYKHSEYILKYKKGDPNTIAFFVKILNNIIYDYFYFYDLIIPVPPSNSYLDTYPNAIVCSYLSALGIIDIIERAVVCLKGHQPGHTGNIKSKIKGLTHISLSDRYDFKYKNIIIMDDIITTGTTFYHIKNALLKKGANSVTGLFLGKTFPIPDFRKEAACG